MRFDAAASLTEVVCARCGSSNRVPVFELRGWKIVDCGDCGLRYVSPRRSAAAYARVYDADYYKSADSLVRGYEDYGAERKSILRTFRKRFHRIERYAGVPLLSGRFLDIGCAYGFALDVAGEMGMQPFGVDVSVHAVAQCQARGLRVELGGADEALKSFGPSMRLVTSWDVIEHLPDPIGHLQAIAKIMEPGGILSLITPDRGSLPARVMGAKWVEYQKPEEHIYFFRRDDIRSFLARLGFEILDWSTAGKHVTVGFAIDRLTSYGGVFFGVLAKAMGSLGERTVYVDPLDKMHVIARRLAG